MKYKVIVVPEAEDDLREAFSWYEDKRTGLGYDFLLQVDAGINFINRNPEIHPIEYKGTRKTCHQKVSIHNHLSCRGRRDDNPCCNSWQEKT
jgi:hypothetical protein